MRTSLAVGYHRTRALHTEQIHSTAHQQNSWSSAFTVHISCSNVSIMKKWRAALGSLNSPIVANLYMEYLRKKPLEQYRILPDFWKGFWMTYCGTAIEHKENFKQHINNIDSVIQLTVEDTWLDGSMPFMDTPVTPKHNGILATGVYRKHLCTLINIYTGTATTA